MVDRLRNAVLAALRVPPAPQTPEGTPGSVRVFRAGRNFYRWQLLTWALSNTSALLGLFVAYRFTWKLMLRTPPWVRDLFVLGEVASLIGLAVAIPFTFLALRWQYELRWYIVTDRSLRIRRGVWSVEEMTMTFANIQEIRVTSGPVQNLLGLADVEVTSAGGGASEHGQGKGHIASFEGVDNANEIRDLLVDRLRIYRDAGLGQPAATAEDAAAGVLEEARSLREALS